METLDHGQGSFLDLPKPKPPGTYLRPKEEKRIWKDGEKPWQVSVAAALLLVNGLLLLLYTMLGASLYILVTAVLITGIVFGQMPYEDGMLSALITLIVIYFFLISSSALHIFRAMNLFQYPPGVTSPPYFTALFGTILGLFIGIPFVPINIAALIFMSSRDVIEYIDQKGRLFYETTR